MMYSRSTDSCMLRDEETSRTVKNVIHIQFEVGPEHLLIRGNNPSWYYRQKSSETQNVRVTFFKVQT